MPNAPRTLKRYYSKPRRVSCSRMYWFEDARNQNPVFRDQKMFPEVRNRPLLLMFFSNNSISRASLFELELWSHTGVFGSIARGHHFLNA